jgi:hypothetical protein
MAIANWVNFDDGYLLLECITLSFGEVVESYLYNYNPFTPTHTMSTFNCLENPKIFFLDLPFFGSWFVFLRVSKHLVFKSLWSNSLYSNYHSFKFV